MVHIGEPFLKLGLPLDAPDRQHVVVFCHKCHRGVGVIDETAREALHCDEADVVFLAFADKRNLPVGCEIAERELDCLVEAGGDGILRDLDLVGRDADVPDLSGGLRLEHRLVEPRAVARREDLVRAVELIDIDIVRAQVPEGRREVLLKFLRRFCLRLRCDEDLLAHAVKCLADLLLTV